VAGSLAVDVTRGAAQNRRHFAGSGVMLDVRHKPSDEAKRVYTAERVNEMLRRNTKQG